MQQHALGFDDDDDCDDDDDDDDDNQDNDENSGDDFYRLLVGKVAEMQKKLEGSRGTDPLLAAAHGAS
jgi:hypothetical protein